MRELFISQNLLLGRQNLGYMKQLTNEVMYSVRQENVNLSQIMEGC